MESFLAERAPEVAFYSEDRGLVSPAGDRAGVGADRRPDRRHPPGAGGVRVRAASRWRPRRWTAEPTMGDVEVGCVIEIKSGRGFVAERGRGLEPAAGLSANTTARADVLDLRLSGTAGACAGRGARRADRRLLGRRRDLRPRLGHLRHDPDRHRPARRLRRAGAADGRRRARRSARSSSGSADGCDPQQLALRPRGGDDLPARRAARSSPTPTAGPSPTGPCSARATSFRCPAWRPPTPSSMRRSAPRSTRGSSGCAPRS